MPIIKIQYSEEEIVKMTTKLVPAICTQCNGSVEVDPSQEKHPANTAVHLSL
ncbi:MAG: hypothetical protein R3D55_16975 [Chloroflexota bacterium]